MDNHADITAAILAGGMGTRLRSAVNDRPKILAEVNGRPFLAFLLDRLHFSGVRHTVLLTGYMGEFVEKVIGHRWEAMRISYSHEKIRSDTGGAIRLALPYFRTPRVLVMNGDSFVPFEIKSLKDSHIANYALISLLLTFKTDVSRYGAVTLDDKGRVVRFNEKNAAGGAGLINAGTYILNTEIIGEIPADRPVSIEREIFPSWIGNGFYGVTTKGPFIDIGTPETYGQACAFFEKIKHRVSAC